MLDEKTSHTLKAIGMPQLCQPIFYNAPIGIRFEISEPFSNAEISERIAVAFKRVSSIYHACPFNFDTLLWVAYPQEEQPAEMLLEQFCAVTKLPPPDEQNFVTVSLEDDEPQDELRCYWDKPFQSASYERLLHEITKADLGGFSELVSSVYLFDTTNHVLFYYYDDRGLDVVAAKSETLLPLYNQFNDYILDYDRKRIDAVFTDKSTD